MLGATGRCDGLFTRSPGSRSPLVSKEPVMHTRIAIAALVVLSAGLLIAADDPDKKKDAEAIKGTWQIISLNADGKDLPKAEVPEDQVIFDGKTYQQKHEDQVVEEGEYVLDPDKSPKAIDFLIKKGQEAGKKQLCVYELDGDSLKICVSQPGDDDRPKALETKPGDRLALMRLKRIKP
jgi:uncharacterized protein (TIGR03067 family)